MFALGAARASPCSCTSIGTDAKPWFYWIAPLLAVGLGGRRSIQLAVGYWMKVGRLETKGRPRSE